MLSASFMTALIIPLGNGNRISDCATLDQARVNILGGTAFGNYMFGVTALPTSAKVMDEDLLADVKSLFVPFVPGHTIDCLPS